ncbi:Wadjet anti-phage system protein JetD domain-containing protein [Kutzneria buriramensis]|uniref:Uncharacterized protein DUF2220 n=1 Tax=Kutzneria buriramensis TaxID=1045776 RepID=A0A3E0GX49_9PSEU|nr:DUF2220 family protein [Kutzneria buriramensis]REH30646.1 uncharacterized protein DUF2220 [Kutzneria buriramensis]
MTLNALAQHLAAHVVEATKQKIEVESLYAAAVEFDRSLATAPAARGEVRRALDELAAAGLVSFPRSPRDFDTRDEPHLPMWVRRPARERVARSAAPARVWPAALEAAGRIASRDEEFAVLDTVTAFLRKGGANRPSVPTRERSLELFGDEKKLDRLMSTRLFTAGALTLDLLRCHSVPIPFVSQWVPGRDDPLGTALLIAENHHTYTTLLTVTRQRAAVNGPGRHVGYGTGGQFASAVQCVPLLSPVPDRIVYFGDIDLKGLQIPLAANDTASRAGLPAVEPAARLYELLFELGRERPARAVRPAIAAEASAWLGPGLASRGRDALVRGVRLPQEAVGYEQLTDRRGQLLDQV